MKTSDRDLCSSEDCDSEKIYARGLCRRHYRSPKECSIKECHESHYAKTYCSLHYQRDKNNLNLNAPVARREPVCIIEDCDKKHHSRGLCATHTSRRRLIELGNTDLEIGSTIRTKDPTRRCSIAGCNLQYYAKTYCVAHYDKHRKMKEQYGITLEQYLKMRQEQDSRCFLCQRKEDEVGKGMLAVDHNHHSGDARKLLCSKCNVGLGMFEENSAVLAKAIEYIEMHR